MTGELLALGLSVGAGIVLFCVYDFFRVLRRVIKHGNALVAGEDLLFWILSSVQAFGFFMFVNKGKYRFYMFLAMLLGAFLYKKTLSRIIVGYFSIFLRKIAEIFGNILKKAVRWVKIKRHKKNGNKTRGGNIEKTEKS